MTLLCFRVLLTLPPQCYKKCTASHGSQLRRWGHQGKASVAHEVQWRWGMFRLRWQWSYPPTKLHIWLYYLGIGLKNALLTSEVVLGAAPEYSTIVYFSIFIIIELDSRCALCVGCFTNICIDTAHLCEEWKTSFFNCEWKFGAS